MDDTRCWSEIDDWWNTEDTTIRALQSLEDVHLLAPQSSAHLWSELDGWWSTHKENQSLILSGKEWPQVYSDCGDDFWVELDEWWSNANERESLAISSSGIRRIDTTWGSTEWEDLDALWDVYAEDQHERVDELISVIDEMNLEWEQSPSRFDRDPLTTDWTPGDHSYGPLRITHEEDWSHWLAHLIRTSSGEFTSRLFGEHFDISPDSVEREVRLHNPTGKNRRIDILADFDSRGLSIEVKVGDENYWKTLETAELIENRLGGEWTHVLLLPQYKSSSVKSVFGDSIETSSSGHGTIERADFRDIKVIYWEELSRALRLTLHNAEEHDPLWEASAYLFISLIEQHIRSFESILPENERDKSDNQKLDEIPITSLQILKTVDIDKQIRHYEITLGKINE